MTAETPPTNDRLTQQSEHHEEGADDELGLTLESERESSPSLCLTGPKPLRLPYVGFHVGE